MGILVKRNTTSKLINLSSEEILQLLNFNKKSFVERHMHLLGISDLIKESINFASSYSRESINNFIGLR